MREINIDDTVWVDMSNCSFTPPHDSGYAVVIDIRVISGSDAVMYCVQFRGSHKVITVDERCITPICEEEDTQERTRLTMRKINIFDIVWVDMSDWAAMPPHESGYAVVVGLHISVFPETCPVIYDVRFRGSDEVIMVNEERVFPICEEEDTQEDILHDKHYRNAVVEPILVMQAFFSHEELIGFLKGNILKYRLRMGHKGTEEDMKADYDKLCVYEMWLDTIKNGERIVL